ncbi:MAG: general secretion pathway protein GspK [Acidobacteriota bacterium]|jgi:general secretion pathway protein K|nr:general secretion pathway protein GspK [Acidobacteriota bacterium]
MRGDEGIILIVVLWVMTALAVLTLSFSRESRIEVLTAGNARSMEKAYYIARAGMESTIYQIIKKRMTPVAQTAFGAEPDQIDLGKVTGSFGGGFWKVNVQDESGKININTVSEQQLGALIRAAGIEEPDALILTDSILDWRDTDDNARDNGAENEYYQSLDPPYTAKNNRFDAVEELLLVRGMTRDYFYGKPERLQDGTVEYKYGLSRFFTVYTTRDQINVNSAAVPTLLSIPGMPPEAARMIYERRQVQPFAAIADINREIPFQLPAGVITRLTTAQTGILTLTAEANEEGARVRRVIRAVVSINTIGAQNPYQILYWNENISDYESGT